MLYDNLPIYKSALDFCVHIEQTVKNFERYHKYSIGEDLRAHSKKILFGIHKANRSKDRAALLEKLRDECEEAKMLLALTKELKAFKSFEQFERCRKLCIEVAKQAQTWLNSAGIVK